MASKIVKSGGARPDRFEEEVAKALQELEAVNAEIKASLRELFIMGAREIEVGGKKAIVIYIPVRLQRQFQKIQPRLIRELEKKFSGRTVVFMAWRRILPKPKRNQRTKQKQLRPRSRTLTAVHEAMLDDLVFPAEVVGKRIRFKLDGTRLLKVHLDQSQQTNIDHKIEIFAGIYNKLTGKHVTFEFCSTD